MTDPDAFSIEGGCACGQPDALAGRAWGRGDGKENGLPLLRRPDQCALSRYSLSGSSALQTRSACFKKPGLNIAPSSSLCRAIWLFSRMSSMSG